MNGSTTVAYIKAVTVDYSGLFVAVGYNSSIYAVYATSSNGSTWTTPALMNNISSDGVMTAAVMNSNRLCVAVGYTNTNNYPLYATSK